MPPAITSTHAGTISLAFPYSLSSNSPALCAFSFVMHGLDPCILGRRQRTIIDGAAPDYLRGGTTRTLCGSGQFDADVGHHAFGARRDAVACSPRRRICLDVKPSNSLPVYAARCPRRIEASSCIK